jgi:hypothetical protein
MSDFALLIELRANASSLKKIVMKGNYANLVTLNVCLNPLE